MPLHIADRGKCETDLADYPVKHFTRRLLLLALFGLLRAGVVGPKPVYAWRSSASCQRISGPTSSSDLPLGCTNTTLIAELPDFGKLWYLDSPEQSATPKRYLFKAKLKVTRHFPK